MTVGPVQPCFLIDEVLLTDVGQAMVGRGELELRRCSICTQPVWWWPEHFDAGSAPICARSPAPDELDADSCFARVFLAVS